jgi:amino acid transporter
VTTLPKQFLLGRPLRTAQMGETLLPKRLALPVFCSDPLSSVAYATEETLTVFALGGAALLHLTWWVAAAIVFLLIVVVASYRQTCYAYPGGGGAYIVSADNLGETAALTAASALLVDYVLTVAVSVVAGVAAITSAAPSLAPHTMAISLGFVVLLTLVNLRGVKESGRAFAIPTYGFVIGIYVMFAFAAARMLTGHTIRAESSHWAFHTTSTFAGLGLALLILRAFASGCTALTGVEAISNGVPAFKKPKSHNAALTLVIMGVLSLTMFIGITILAMLYHVHIAESPEQLGLPANYSMPTALAQIAKASFGNATFLFYYVQAVTAAILILAANTAYNGFPMLSSILAQDRYLPRQLHNRGDRLVFSNGVILLALAASGLIIVFDADLNSIINLYIIGVFVSFTLSQSGMVRHWGRKLADSATGTAGRGRMRRSQLINATGAVLTGMVLVVVTISKFEHGAWIVTIAMPLLFLAMKGVRKHYRNVADELRVADGARPEPPSRNHAVVLVSTLHAPALRALGYAQSMRPDTVEALTVAVDQAAAEALQQKWDAHEIGIPLKVLDSPYREITRPVLDYVRTLRRGPRDVITVLIPEYVLGHWWEQILHNQSALRLKARLLFKPGVMVISVPYLLQSAQRRKAREHTAAEPATQEAVAEKA